MLSRTDAWRARCVYRIYVDLVFVSKSILMTMVDDSRLICKRSLIGDLLAVRGSLFALKVVSYQGR